MCVQFALHASRQALELVSPFFQRSDHAVAELEQPFARDELVAIVDSLEKGTASLDESVALWERGEALAKRCEEWLAGARQRLDAARKPA